MLFLIDVSKLSKDLIARGTPEAHVRIKCYTQIPMEWKHKGITYTISTRSMGDLVMASARAPQEGMFVRVRPFSAIGTDEKQALELLKEQIRTENLKVPFNE